MTALPRVNTCITFPPMQSELSPGAPLQSVWNEVGGIRVHGLVSAGPRAAGVPIVFVHGLGVSSRYMEPTMALLARDHAVAALDFPGFGLSGTPSHALSLAELAQSLGAWLDARGIGPAVFVGNSFGCQVIVECVTREPARAVGLVLNAPTIDPAHRSARSMISRVLLDVPREPFSLAWLVTRAYLRAGPFRLLTTLRAALADRIEEKLPRITVPVAVVAGARDPVVTVAWAEEVAQLVGRERPGAAGAMLYVVPDLAHAMPYDAPTIFASLITTLLARVPHD